MLSLSSNKNLKLELLKILKDKKILENKLQEEMKAKLQIIEENN